MVITFVCIVIIFIISYDIVFDIIIFISSIVVLIDMIFIVFVVIIIILLFIYSIFFPDSKHHKYREVTASLPW